MNFYHLFCIHSSSRKEFYDNFVKPVLAPGYILITFFTLSANTKKSHNANRYEFISTSLYYFSSQTEKVDMIRNVMYAFICSAYETASQSVCTW